MTCYLTQNVITLSHIRHDGYYIMETKFPLKIWIGKILDSICKESKYIQLKLLYTQYRKRRKEKVIQEQVRESRIPLSVQDGALTVSVTVGLQTTPSFSPSTSRHLQDEQTTV